MHSVVRPARLADALCSDKDGTRSASSETAGATETAESPIAKALAHPLGARILQRLGKRLAARATSPWSSAPLAVVSYHVRMLRDYDCVELVRIEPRSGALQHLYKATARPNLDDASGARCRRACAASRPARRSRRWCRISPRPPTPARSRTRRSCSRARRWSSTSAASRSSTSCWPTHDQALAIAAKGAAWHNEEATEVFPTELGVLHFKRAT